MSMKYMKTTNNNNYRSSTNHFETHFLQDRSGNELIKSSQVKYVGIFTRQSISQ